MTWLLALGQRLLGLAPVRWAIAGLGAVLGILATIAAARRSGRKAGQAEAVSEARARTIEDYQRRDRATAAAPQTLDELAKRARDHRL
jgi:type II secretory pathway pseudopilin PulG